MWKNFQQRHESSTASFEALCCQLFERWCRKEYGDSIRSFYFLDGRGGDGGVEAFAVLDDESVVGLQAKAFWDGFKNSQKTQVANSLSAATKRHPKLKRYIVCCPLNLLESKGPKNEGKSQRERWGELEVESQKKHPNVTLEYRGETKILEWTQSPESETICAYWFDKIVLPRGHWREQFLRIKSAWLDLRYIPDLHVATILDEKLSWFVSSSNAIDQLKATISRLANSLRDRRDQISNLKNLPGNHSSEALSESNHLVEAINIALKNLSLLHANAESQYLPTIDGNFSIDSKTCEAITRLSDELAGKNRLTFATSPTQSVAKAVDGLMEDLNAVHDLIKTQQHLHQMYLILGEAGTGKTQTITKLCDSASASGVPVLALPARAYDPSRSWTEILAQASNRPTWNADEVLDALEACTLYAWRDSTEPRLAPRRAILALDGPDENSAPGAWSERLIELADLCKNRPLIAPIVTTRPESRSWLPLGDERFHLLHVHSPDVSEQLPEIFQAYIAKYDIKVPTPNRVAWALKTPFAIRTFAEVYKGKTIAAGQDFVTTLSELFRMKLQRLDEELHHRNPAWPIDKELSLRILRALTPSYLKNGECPYEQFTECIRNCLTPLGISIENAAALFEQSAMGHGLIEIYQLPTKPMDPSQLIVQFGFNALLDYLLAIEMAENTRLLLGERSIHSTPEVTYPSALYGRSNAASLVVAMLLKDGISILDLGLWEDSVAREDLEIWHTRAILDLSPNLASNYEEWVSDHLRRDMGSCRMIVAELILPSSRVPNSTYGAEYLHQKFSQMSLTDRDLIWSGPDWLPSNCDGRWEGNGVPVHDSITLRNDDSENSAPILAAWVTSSVILDRKNKAVASLAKWGSKCPRELADLLRRFSSCDDVQIVESVTVAAAGAALNLVEHGSADELAKAAHEVFFVNWGEEEPPSVVARHAARLVIERAFKVGTELSEAVLAAATPPYSPVGPKLPIDAKSVSDLHGKERGGGGEFPLSSDLDWYVAAKARDPFFKHIPHRHAVSKKRRFESISLQILNAALTSEIEVDLSIHSEISQEIEERNQNQRLFRRSSLTLPEAKVKSEKHEENTTPLKKDEKNPLSQKQIDMFFELSQGSSEAQDRLRFEPEAEAILAEYAEDISQDTPLNPRQLGNGLILALVKKWGWNKKTFYGDPRGEQPGEVLGADIAILRRHPQARHGSRSSVAMFSEKYVWSAVNVVSSFLCDRLPGENDGDSELSLITNQSNLGSRMPDPLVGHRPDKKPEFRPAWNPEGIAITPAITESKQPERGIKWLENADLPTPENWLNAAADEPILLSGFLHTKDHKAGVQIAVWVSCVAVPRAQISLIERDVTIAPELWTNSHLVHELEGYFGGGIYTPVKLAVWDPWAPDNIAEIWHTLDDNGEPVQIPLLPLVTKALWDGTEGETSARSPSKLLRDAGKIIDCRGTDSAMQFVNPRGEEFAYFQQMNFPDDWSKSNQHLVIQRAFLFQTLAEHDLVPIWGVRVYRELLPELSPKGEFLDQDSYWMIIPKEDGQNFRSSLISSGYQGNLKSAEPSPSSPNEETQYLFSSPANAERLRQGLEDFEKGNVSSHQLAE